MEFAEGGQLIEWDDEELKFYFCHEEDKDRVLTEDDLRKIFRGCV